ncbi:GNAT family N-acetyltransferase [Oligoflexus sp.]|uniref:GNAT family N-acetyltransferase n=1 Tax=Oligoflexus sp. TaxID=1971216 RepID=UPI002D76B80B|nr:GNAT family N-acetyltransferase [Oligoflexus sp.]
MPYFVVTNDEKSVLACGGFVIEKRVGELAWGMVREDIHRQGIGRSYSLGGWTRPGRPEPVIMDTSQHRLGFYQRLGFQILSGKPDGYGPGLDRYDLRLNLDRASY